MQFPKLNDPQRYIGLYAVDLGDHSAVGLTATEVAELLESENSGIQSIYRIHKVDPDGRIEWLGVPKETFLLEAGMFFYSRDLQAAGEDFCRLCDWANQTPPPARAKIHLARRGDNEFVVALIYPAEYDDAFSRWLLDGNYRTAGFAEGGTAAVQRYYHLDWNVLERRQFWPQESIASLTGQALHTAVRRGIVR